MSNGGCGYVATAIIMIVFYLDKSYQIIYNLITIQSNHFMIR